MSVLALSFIVAPATPAASADCREVAQPDGTVITICEDEDGGGGGGDGDGEGGGDNQGPRTCRLEGREIPCTSEFGVWDGYCYVRVVTDDPNVHQDVWGEHTDGVIVECSPIDCVGGPDPCPDAHLDWAPSGPAAAGPSAEELARRAVASMGLTMGEIGSTPPASASNIASVGTIGLPVWLWIADRAENTVGPITRSASDGGLSVTATGTLNRVEWTLTSSDGAIVGSISCEGANAAGTPFDGRNTAEPSPTCGFGADLNRTPGVLTLTGTAYWVVEWQGGGQSGQIEVPPQSNSTQIRIGELQALLHR
ncbi:hypothetical protein GCM10010102_05130 [Promicromonospora citrea]|uniref:ATP/GTP-binding protein n=1 Tax=Promicromonospora citrea TaxID=43677 RepID=A0A8H9GDF7_9MICO|nr:hypothetical protein GCM10010102_05130 [Promicromonospora citrea]